MRSGEIRRPVLVQQPIGPVADFGGGAEDWEDYRECWAKIRPLSASERLESQQMQQQTTHRIEMRVHPDKPIDTTMIIRVGTRRFEIRGVYDPEEIGAELVLMCDEVTGGPTPQN